MKEGSTPLTLGTDYSVAYSNNTNAGTATVTLEGKGKYEGTKIVNFTINPATQAKPSAPTKASSTTTSITLTTVAGCKYKRDGGEWQDNPTFTGLAEGTTYTFYQQLTEKTNYYASPVSDGAQLRTTIPAFTVTVTFKVKNGEWDDGGSADKTVTLSRAEDEDKVLKLEAGDIPAVGTKPVSGCRAGAWDTEPTTETALNADKIYTYTYAGTPTPPAPPAPAVCEHKHTELRDYRAATCTLAGYTGDTYCKDCGEKIKSGEIIPASGHNFVKGTCTVCGAKDPNYSSGGSGGVLLPSSFNPSFRQNSDGSVTLGWNKIPNAKNYTVFIEENGVRRQLKTTDRTNLKVIGLKNGKQYTFMVKYNFDGYKTPDSLDAKIKVTPNGKPASTAKVTDAGVELSWTKVPNATSYQICKFVNGKLKTLGETSGTKALISGADGGTFAVRAVVNGEKTKVKRSDLVTAE